MNDELSIRPAFGGFTGLEVSELPEVGGGILPDRHQTYLRLDDQAVIVRVFAYI